MRALLQRLPTRVRSVVAWAIIAAVVCSAVAGIVVSYRLKYLNQLLPVGPGPARLVRVERGMGPQAIAALLAEQGLIQSAGAFRRYVREQGVAQRLQAGCYEFSPGRSVAEIVEKLRTGDVAQQKLTIPEGLWLTEIAQRLEEEGFCKAAEFTRAASDAERIREFGLAGADAANLEGFLFPETYTVGYDVSAEELVEIMLDQFRRAVAPLTDEAAGDGRSWREIVTLASLVEAEARQADERGLIAGVYSARLAKGMKLECDPTVIYAHGRRMTRLRDVSIDSPYNTYRYRGLPPGPICNPGLGSIEAALHPDDTECLYFVAKPDGHHAFARTYGEHRENVRRYLGR